MARQAHDLKVIGSNPVSAFIFLIYSIKGNASDCNSENVGSIPSLV